MFTHQFLLRRSIDERDIKTRDKASFVKRESFFLSKQSISYNYEPDSLLLPPYPPPFFFSSTLYRRNHKLLGSLKFLYPVHEIYLISSLDSIN